MGPFNIYSRLIYLQLPILGRLDVARLVNNDVLIFFLWQAVTDDNTTVRDNGDVNPFLVCTWLETNKLPGSNLGESIILCILLVVLNYNTL